MLHNNTIMREKPSDYLIGGVSVTASVDDLSINGAAIEFLLQSPRSAHALI